MYEATGSYRHIEWDSLPDLSQKLHRHVNTIYAFLRRNNSARTCEDYIDYVLGDNTYEEYVKQGYSKNELITYRGITFRNNYELTKKLLITPNAVSNYLADNPNKTVKDYIDSQLLDSTYEEYLQNEGVGYRNHRGYQYRSLKELGKMLDGSSMKLYNWLYRNPDKTEKDYIDYKLSLPEMIYRGVNCKNPTTAAKDLQVSRQAIHQWLQYHPTKNVRDYVDKVLQEFTLEEYLEELNTESSSFSLTR